MKNIIELITAVIFSVSFLFGGGYGIIKIHDAVKKEVLEQTSTGLSSSEKLGNALTGESLNF